MKYPKREQIIIDELTLLYESRGFRRYKPSCFEEYALYQENKDFLIGKNVITFSDLGGKLMAMRPDVTLSLVRHNEVESGKIEKFFYNEKVYRQTAGGSNYKEIAQTGVEIVGEMDSLVLAELTILICQTLAVVDKNYVLDISHMGFTEGLLREFGPDGKVVSKFLRSKNIHDFNKFAESRGYAAELKNAFEVTVSVNGSPTNVLEKVRAVALNNDMLNAVSELSKLCDVLCKFGYGEKVNIDFSASGNAEYYNGFIFNGYLRGIPQCVLTGGRYDRLMRKLGKNGGAVGFALYLGEIERYLAMDDYTVDYLVIYDDKTELKALEFAENALKSGRKARLSRQTPNGLSYKNLIDLTVGEVEK